MTVETPTPPTAQLTGQLTRLQSELEGVQKELDQALVVWRTTLAAEREEFERLLQQESSALTREEQAGKVKRRRLEQRLSSLASFSEKLILNTFETMEYQVTALKQFVDASRSR